MDPGHHGFIGQSVRNDFRIHLRSEFRKPTITSSFPYRILLIDI